MAVKIIVKYQKPGATFPDGDAAYADKNSNFTDEFKAKIDNSYDLLLQSGVLLEPITKTWDQEHQILTIEKLVTDVNAFLSGLEYSQNEAATEVTAYGWVPLGSYEVVV